MNNKQVCEILRNAFQNLKRAKDAVVHADVAYRVIRTVQVVAQHWHFNAFTLEPMDVVSSKQKKKGEGSSYFVEEDGRHRDLNDYSKAHRRGGDDSKKVSTLEKVAKFFGDPVHAAIVKFGMVFFIATIVWSAYYPILQSHSQKCSKKTFLDHIVPEDDVDDAHESLRLGVFDRLFRRVVDGDDFIYAPVFVRDRGDARAGVGGDRRRRLGRSG